MFCFFFLPVILFRGNFSSKTTCAITFVCLGRACRSQKNYKGYNLLEYTSVFERRGYRGLLLSFCPKGLISNSPHCLLQNSYDVSLENFVLDQLRILPSISSSILITCSLDIVRRNSVFVTCGSWWVICISFFFAIFKAEWLILMMFSGKYDKLKPKNTHKIKIVSVTLFYPFSTSFSLIWSGEHSVAYSLAPRSSQRRRDTFKEMQAWYTNVMWHLQLNIFFFFFFFFYNFIVL